MPQRVYNLFQQSVEAKMQVGEELAPRIQDASQRMVDCLLDEKKILVCGNGASAAMAQILASCLIDRYEKERPGLPAIWLGNTIAAYSPGDADSGYAEIFAKPVRALGQAGDVLVIFSTNGNAANLVQAVDAAHDRELSVIAVTGRDGGNVASILNLNDVEICAAVDSRSRIHEIHLLSIFCLCDLIDHQIFGIE